MSDAFIPVDLDKLLDDFEEHDSSPLVTNQRQSSGNNQGNPDGGRLTDDCDTSAISGFGSSKTFQVNGLVSNTNPGTSFSKEIQNDLLSNTGSDSTHANNVNIDLLSTDVTKCDSSLSANTNSKSNGQSGHNIEQKHRDSRNLPSSLVGNLVDLTDVEVSSKSSILNGVDLLGDVGSQPDIPPPDITNGITNTRTYQNDLLSDMGSYSVNLPNSLHQDLLLLDINNPIDNCHRPNSNCGQTLPDNTSDKNILNKESGEELSAVCDNVHASGSNLINMPPYASSYSDTENSLIDLTTEDTKPEIPASLIGSASAVGFPAESTKGHSINQSLLEEDYKGNGFNVERSDHVFSDENIQRTSTNQTLMDRETVPLNKTEVSTGVPGINPCDIDTRTDEYNATSDDITHAAISNIPNLSEEGEPSLLFLQDHFGNSELARDIINNVNTPVYVNNENNTLETNNGQNIDEMNGRQETPAETIPVAQDAVTEASDELSPMGNSYEVLESEQPFQLGYTAPPWLPDTDVNRCMSCQCKFTVVKRRHHCRACGKIYCSSCCNLKFNLQYLEDKLARVCQACANILLQRQAALANQPTSISDNDEAGMYLYLNPHDQPEPPGDIPVEQNVEDVVSQTEQPPDYEETEVQTPMPVEMASVVPVFTEDAMTESTSQVTQFRPSTCSSSSSLSSADIPVTSTIPLPPLLKKTDEGLKIDDSPNHQDLLYLLKKRKETVMFLLNKHLVVKVKIVKLNCCVKRKCWCFSSEGMQAADQEDMVILLECVPKESSIPQDVLSHFNTAFKYAKQGHRVTDLGYTIFGQPFLGSLRNAGFLYVKSSFQCLDNLLLPSGPHIFGILIQREEVSWVQLFPIRLILRLGAEYRYYPCPLWSVRDREPLYGEIGHTIMDLLADFKNFQYTLPRVTGMHVHLEDKKVVIQLPQNRYDEVLKVLNATDEFVMAFEATFSNVADAHLVCIQEGTSYKTQSINLEGQERKVTAASFIVFNGALKTTTDVKAKVSIVEDGVMVQMIRQMSEEMRQAMREMSDFTIHTGCPDTDGVAIQQVVFEWVSKRNLDTQSVLSPIDGLTLGTTSDIKINTHFDFSTPSIFRLRWTELFFLEHTGSARNLPAQFKQTTADIAKACTVALRPYLINLYQMERRRIGLRVNLSPDMVGYIIGSQGSPLPDEMATNLDNELVPAIHNAVNPSSSTPSSMEFLFNIVEMLS
ncbi:zinc finger FYVE domain-containing 9 isoform X2 [Paramuricea clavata]|uniref:Zinc finger FYVE domain-containing 9 isoform X2 n=1 Tax=Paramuricea clavata TaxID=317549 RepID=A0A6S7FXE7_PARCT|nr:zinc finger FYVE domain-containing 9 isoform X2 [Paramuricea clavata]